MHKRKFLIAPLGLLIHAQLSDIHINGAKSLFHIQTISQFEKKKQKQLLPSDLKGISPKKTL